MSNKRLLYTGIGLGLLSVVLLNIYIWSNQQSFTFLKFKQPLKKGEKISERVLEKISIPKNFGSVLKEAVLAQDKDWVVGKALLRDVATGDFLLYSHISAAPDEDFDKKLDKNKRALSIQVTSETGVSGFIEPGSFVDIVATIAEPGGSKQSARISTKTILQKVKVLAVGDRFLKRRISGPESDRMGSTTVTLELTPLQVEKVVFAQHHAQGPLRFVLVNPESSPEVDTPVMSWENFDQIK